MFKKELVLHRILFFSLLILLMPSLSLAEKMELPPEQRCDSRIPEMEVKDAISFAEKSAQRYFPDDGAYIDSIVLNCTNKNYTWVIGFRRKAYESGHLLVSVEMDGSTKISVIKDG